MSDFLAKKKLITAAVPVAILVAVLAGLLWAANARSTDQQSQTSRDQRNRSQITESSHSRQAAQIAGARAGASQKGTSADPRTTDSNSVLRVYRCAPGTAQAVAARLQQEFGASPYVRIVADPRTSQVLAMAPPDVQTQINHRAAELTVGIEQSPSAAEPASRPLDASSPPQPVARREVQLLQTTASQLETELLRVLGRRLSPVAGSNPDESAYQLALANGQTLKLSVNRRSNRVRVEGVGVAVDSSVQLIHALDNPEPPARRGMRLISVKAGRSAEIQRAMEIIEAAQNVPGSPSDELAIVAPRAASQVALLWQQPNQAAPDATSAAGQIPAPPQAAPGAVPADGQPPEQGEQVGALRGPVQIQPLEGLDSFIIRGPPADVQRLLEIIRKIEEVAEVTKPAIEVLHLRYVDSTALADLLVQVYQEVFLLRQGIVSITSLVKPNALLLIGRRENVDTVIDLARRLDRPVAPGTQFRVFRLRHAAAQTIQATIEQFFADREGLGTRVRVTADFRSNSLVVQASPRDMAEVAAMIHQIDTRDIEAESEIRLIPLYNSLADQVAPILQSAISGQVAPGQQVPAAVEPKSSMLRFITIDPEGHRLLKKSGILTDVQITADPRANALLVRAPAESMSLIEALIRELDRLPPVEAQIKVFPVVNGDANTLATMLETLFAEQVAGEQPVVPAAVVERESSLVSLRFAVDERTNSIIATGSVADLSVVEAILLRLDIETLRRRQTVVYRLKNAFATNVANAVTQFLSTELQVQQTIPGLSPYEQIEREVVIVPEEVSNSLIVSATDQYFKQVTDLVEQLDARPPMVMIQVLIAEVLLTDTDEFGVELGIQDPIFFNRSEDGEPGFQFLTNPPGNNTTVPGSDIIGTQALSSLGVGRTGGGLILAASSEAVSILIRALKAEGRADILGRPQVTAMDNQIAQVSVGESVPSVSGTMVVQNTLQSVVSYQDVGLILTVRPRISPDRQVVMEIEATKSSVSEAEGITIAVAEGEPIRAPRFNIATARTVISAADGQTVILGGLITKDRSRTHRRVPWLGELPLVGWAFQWNSLIERKTELLIIMTPHIIESDEDVEVIKQVEAARMNWCLSDVLELHGEDGIPGIAAPPADAGTTVIYPDLDPGGERVPTLAPSREHPKPVPSPQGSPFILEPMPQESDPGGSAPGPGPTSTIQPLRSWDASAGYVQPGRNGQAAPPPGLPNDVEQAVYEPYDQSPGAPAVPQSSLYAPNGWEQAPPDRERLLSNPLRDY